MISRTATLVLCLSSLIAFADCAAAEKAPVASSQSYSGWYLQHAGKGTFRPCGQDKQWRVNKGADLRARARAFGLEPDTPVYVRVSGKLSAAGDALKVLRVEQFGSPTPVRNCAMNGVVISTPAPAVH